MTIGELNEMIGRLTVNELVEITEELKKRFNLTITHDADLLSVNKSPVNEQVVFPTEFKVVLMNVSDPLKKVQVIKLVREITGLGLKESKDLVDSAPKTLKDSVSQQEADLLKFKFSEVSGVVEVTPI